MNKLTHRGSSIFLLVAIAVIIVALSSCRFTGGGGGIKPKKTAWYAVGTDQVVLTINNENPVSGYQMDIVNHRAAKTPAYGGGIWHLEFIVRANKLVTISRIVIEVYKEDKTTKIGQASSILGTSRKIETTKANFPPFVQTVKLGTVSCFPNQKALDNMQRVYLCRFECNENETICKKRVFLKVFAKDPVTPGAWVQDIHDTVLTGKVSNPGSDYCKSCKWFSIKPKRPSHVTVSVDIKPIQ